MLSQSDQQSLRWDMISLSVVLPCRNAAKSIRTQLDALAAQSWDKSWEVIIVDHESTDGTDCMIDEYCSHQRNFRSVRTSGPAGSSHPRNVGVVEARSDKIAFVDADDMVAPGWVAAMGNALATHEFVAGCKEFTKLNSSEVMKVLNHIESQGVHTNYYLPCAPSCNLGVSRAVHEAIGGFDTALRSLEDTDYCWRAAHHGVQLVYAPDAVVHYQLRHSPREIYRWRLRHGVAMIQLYQRHRAFGMPKPIDWRESVRIVRSVFLGPLRIRDKTSFLRWLNRAGGGIGLLYGCVKCGYLPV
jgi:glycosyltransferase involved in cell wall biosynthesis